MEPKILFEDDFIIAFNKPSGMMVHHDTHTKTNTLTDWIVKNRPQIIRVGEDMFDQKGIVIARPGIVHRLDRDTSGVLLVAKTQESYNFLKQIFKERRANKIYRGIVYGNVKADTGVINKPIIRSSTDFRKKAIRERMVDGAREALTEYKTLKRTELFSYLEIYPKTGRTHQIRAHLNSIGHPVVCDTLYAPKKECPKILGRMALHAYNVEFLLPNNNPCAIEAPLPEEFKTFLDTL